jgi:ATP adenylyltransferase
MNETIYAPWRTEFILGRREKGCVFCTRYTRKTDRDDFILYRGKKNFILMNLYPYNAGHIMVIPNRHISTLAEMRPAERAEMMELAAESEVIMKQRLKPQGLNMGFNFGAAGGAGIRDHLHLHILPRWVGDTNFLPALYDTRVNSVDLPLTYDILLPGFEKLAGKMKACGRRKNK